MSMYFIVGDKTRWNPSNGAGRLFLRQVEVFEAELKLASGIGQGKYWGDPDTLEVDPAAYAEVARGLVAWHRRTGHCVFLALSEGFVAQLAVSASCPPQLRRPLSGRAQLLPTGNRMSVPADTITIMSHNIAYSTADKADVLAYLGSNGNLTPDQLRRLEGMRKDAQAHQDDLDHQGIDWGLSIPDALDRLLAGRTDSATECAGNAYNSAVQHIIDHNASDPYQLGTFSKPSTFFGLVDDEMRRLGVPADLLPHGYLYGGLPDDFPYIPHSMDGYPAIGHLPLAKTKAAADAYSAVLDRMDPDFRYDIQELIEKLNFEHGEWDYATKNIDWYTQDTLFFKLT
ncbi:DUF6086 family protein [Streptomyces avermitilis]|uniref:DUF7691 family protein n=1 Tax=Streptomyces avermitilis TaxID=33903 RepID=UPI0033A35016